jgi:hypothetical protein
MNVAPLIDSDRELERRIQTAAVRVSLARTREEHDPLWREFVELIRQRSPRQIAKMERERGLR